MRPSKTGPFRASPNKNQGNRYSPLAEFSSLPVKLHSHIMVTPPRVPTINKPSSSKMTIIGSIPRIEGPFQQVLSKASTSLMTRKLLTSSHYEMKTPESFAQTVNPNTPSKREGKKLISEEKENFELIPKSPIMILALDKGYENLEIGDLVRPCYTNRNYVESSDPLKTRRYYEFILIDT